MYRDNSQLGFMHLSHVLTTCDCRQQQNHIRDVGQPPAPGGHLQEGSPVRPGICPRQESRTGTVSIIVLFLSFLVINYYNISHGFLLSGFLWRQMAIIFTVLWQCHPHVRNVALWRCIRTYTYRNQWIIFKLFKENKIKWIQDNSLLLGKNKIKNDFAEGAFCQPSKKTVNLG